MKKLGLTVDPNTVGDGDIFYNIKETKQIDIVLEHIPAHPATAEVMGVYTLTIVEQPSAGDKLTINDRTFEFVSNVTAGKVLIGATTTETASALKTAIDTIPFFNLTTSTNTVIFTQKEAEVGDIPTIAIEKVENSVFDATIETTAVGVVALANDRPAGYLAKKGALIMYRYHDNKYFLATPGDLEYYKDIAGILGMDTDSTVADAKTFIFVEGQFVKSKVEEATGFAIKNTVIFNNNCNIILKEEI